jgi:hypothetical protein
MKRLLLLSFFTLLFSFLQAQTYTTVRLDTLKAKTTGRQTIALGAGLKFPDNTTQLTSASSVAHDTALTLIRHESDPLFKAHPANTISSANIFNWNNAFSWGNHAAAGYIKYENDPGWLTDSSFFARKEYVNSRAYTLPMASNSTLGGVKVGSGLTIDGSGLLSISGNTAFPIVGNNQTNAIKLSTNTVHNNAGLIDLQTNSSAAGISLVNNGDYYGMVANNNANGAAYTIRNSSTGVGIFGTNEYIGKMISLMNMSAGTCMFIQNVSTGIPFQIGDGSNDNRTVLNPTVTDGASAVAYTFDCKNLSTSGSKIVKVANNTTEKFSIDKDGNVNIPAGSNYKVNGVPLGSGSGTVTSITTASPLTGGTITSTGAIGINPSNSSSDGYLSSTDWNTFNGKQTQLNGTGFVKSSGTSISYDNTSYQPSSTAWNTTNLNLPIIDFNAKNQFVQGGSSAPAFNIHLSNAQDNILLQSYSSNTDFGWKLMQDEQTTGDLYLKRRLSAVDDEAIRFKRSNGYVGIGKTPSYKLDINGDVNIPAGSTYRVNGVPIATGGGNSDVSKTLINYHSTDTASVIWTEGDNVPGSYIYTGGQGSVPLILETEINDVSLIVKSQLYTVLKVTRSEGIVVPSIKGDKNAWLGAEPTSNAGTGATAYITPGSTNLAGQLTLSMGSGSISTGRQVYVNFDGPFPTAPFVILYPANSMAGTKIISDGFYVESDTNGFWITNDNYDPIGVYPYVERKWNYMIIQ